MTIVLIPAVAEEGNRIVVTIGDEAGKPCTIVEFTAKAEGAPREVPVCPEPGT